MADESYRWLDLDTAERLLRGESLEAVDEATRDQAERLAGTLAALTAKPAPTSTELPGEEAALAAFRKVRADRADDWVSPPARGRLRVAGDLADAGLVRIGAPGPKAAPQRRRRPAHLALAAVLAAGVVGGAAAVAGTGVLAPSGHDEPEPGASVTADPSPNHPLLSPTPRAPQVVPSPGGSPSGDARSRDTARGDTGAARGSASEGLGGRFGGDWRGAVSACRDLRDGKELNPTRRHSLEGAAGGSPRVWKYCEGVLSEGGAKSGSDGRKGGRGEGGDNDKSGPGDNNDDEKSGPRRGNGRGGHGGHGGNSGSGQGDEDGSGGQNGGQSGGQFMAPHNRPGPNGAVTELASGTPLVRDRATMSPGPEPTPEPGPSSGAV